MRFLAALFLLRTMSSLAEESSAAVDLSGDGGVVRTATLRAGAGPTPRPGQIALLTYVGRLDGGATVDEATAQRLTVGGEGNVRGLDVAAASMAAGERAAFTVRHDYAYGAVGLGDRIPPHAQLFYEIELAAVEDAAAAVAADDVLALPAAEDAATRVEVGGAPVKLDHLGPVVVNTDGTLSRITNWVDMTEAERARTTKIITKRNEKRLKALRSREEGDL